MLLEKILCIILCAAFAAALFSCAENASPVGDTTAPDLQTEPEVYSDGLPDIDMEGFSLNIMHFDNTWLTWANNILDAEEPTGDLLSDEVYNRNLYIKERFNCDIHVGEMGQVSSQFVTSLAAAGDASWDICMMYDLWILDAVTHIMPWNDIPYVDLEQTWWSPAATEVFDIGGRQLSVAGNFSVSVLSRAAGYVFNKKILEDLNTGLDIYRLASDGKWTLDVFYELGRAAVSDINGDGVFNDGDRYGVSGSVKEHYSRLLQGSDIKYITKDEEGWPLFNLPYDETALNKIQHIIELNKGTNVHYNTTANVNDSAPADHFKNGHTLFAVAPAFSIEGMRDYEIEIGIIPVPKYDENQKRYFAPSFGAEVAVLPASFDMTRAENMGLLLEALSIHSERNMIQTYKEIMLKTKYTRDSESEAMLDIIFESISFEFGINAWQETVAIVLMNKIFNNLDDTVVSTLTGMEKTVNAKIDKLIKAVSEIEM